MTLTYLLTLIFALNVIAVSLDFFTGLPLNQILDDLLVQGSILAVVLFTANYIWRQFKTEIESKELIKKNLESAQLEAFAWERKSKDFVKEFHQFVLLKFDEWKLSKSEKEIGLLILRGKSSKEIATHRFTSERTIRNQCRAIYEKSKMGGKNEFSAFFLGELIEDLSL